MRKLEWFEFNKVLHDRSWERKIHHHHIEASLDLKSDLNKTTGPKHACNERIRVGYNDSIIDKSFISFVK